MGIPWEWKWYFIVRMRMGRSGNERKWEWPLFQRENSRRFSYCYGLALGYTSIRCRCTVETFFFWFSNYCRRCLQNFYFSMIDVQFSVDLFFCCSTADCLHLRFTVLMCVSGNGMGMEITQLESHGNMGIRLRLGNENGKEWELTAVKWEGIECKTQFPVISTLYIAYYAAHGSYIGQLASDHQTDHATTVAIGRV